MMAKDEDAANSNATARPWLDEHKFKPGQSGNPSGRPKGIASKAREHADKCIQVLTDALTEDDAKTRIAAAKELLDRGFGKAVAMTADVTNRLEEFDDADLDAAISALRTAIQPIGEDGSGEGKQITH